MVRGVSAVVLLAGLVVCRALEPSPTRRGTHTQLGLPGCLVCRVTGLERCPSCGLTTAFAHLTRGQWREADAANPAGPVLFVLCCGAIVYCATMAVTGINRLVEEMIVLGFWGVGTLAWWILALFR